MAKFDYEYYSGEQTEQFRFLKIPKIFFEDPDYEDLGLCEMVLYGFLHEQVSLSKQNGWIDEEGRVYVLRSVKSMQKVLKKCSEDKARATLKNLIDFGLVEKKRRGQGKPDLIYVKDFVSKKQVKSDSGNSDQCGKLFSEPEKNGVLNEEKSDSGSGNFRVLESGKIGPIENNNNYTQSMETQSIHPAQPVDKPDHSHPIKLYRADGLMENTDPEEDERESYAKLIKYNIQYDANMIDLEPKGKSGMFDELYNIILDAVTGKAKEYKIKGTVFPQAVVKSRMLKLNGEDVKEAIDQICGVKDKILNPTGYMLSTLYNVSLSSDTRLTNLFEYYEHGNGRPEIRERQEKKKRQSTWDISSSDGYDDYDWDKLEASLTGRR